MRKVLKYSGIISLVIAVIAFIFMLALPAITMKLGNSSTSMLGGAAIFGGSFGTAVLTYKGTAVGIIAFILVIVAMLLLCLGVAMPFLKVKKLNKFAGLLNLIAVVCLVVAGVLLFFILANWFGANGISGDATKAFAISAGPIISGIMLIAAGCFAILPAAIDFTSKK